MSASPVILLAAALFALISVVVIRSGSSPDVTSLEAGLGPEVIAQPL